ncbi:MAG TPA: heme ABC exporter ATP-binding protein CcmA [Acidimicrobiales bacterium]|jgi:heme ABC exporter ATP-binding subunit CcmA|nr:heme ABC exporter ATP-binding protein CcmA [Acidimicrobiales bacterium]
MAPIVRFRSAVSLLGRFPALAGVDLDVAGGDVLLVHGPNGAGKTTLLRACAGLVAIGAGEAQVLGHDLCRDRRAVRRRVGLLGHASFLYDELTVEENLRFAARAAKRPTGAAEEAMARMGIDGRLRHVTVGRLSSGQRRRAAIAAVVARQPELWLLDEPHAGLDAGGRELLDAIVGEVATSGGTVILASHELDRAAALASRQVLMAGGRVTGGLLDETGTDADATAAPDRREAAGVVA